MTQTVNHTVLGLYPTSGFMSFMSPKVSLWSVSLTDMGEGSITIKHDIDTLLYCIDTTQNDTFDTKTRVATVPSTTLMHKTRESMNKQDISQYQLNTTNRIDDVRYRRVRE